MAQNTSSVDSQAVELFRSDLVTFVHKALNERFPDAEAMNKFRLKTREERCGLKERARTLGLNNFRLEYVRAHDRALQEREAQERQRQAGTEAA